MPEAMSVVLATRNPHKVEEIRAAVSVPGIEFRGLHEFPDAPEATEDGDTFEANAVKKALVAAAATGLPALADDSGLWVDAIGGEPGVHSARYAGEHADDGENRALLLERMLEVEEQRRSGRFVCVIAIAMPDGGVETCEGTCEGKILEEERGTEGFGYDSLFVPEGESRTFAEMTRDEKAELSHRGRALRAARPLLEAMAAAHS
jgi:XTP/dITP diphosphohydrolase